MSEVATFRMVKSAWEQAEKAGFKVDWTSEFWMLEHEVLKLRIRGTTATEMLYYLSGFSDGKFAKNYTPPKKVAKK